VADEYGDRLLQIRLQRASRDRGISGLGPVETVPDRSQPRQPKKAQAQPTAPAKKPPAKKPATKAPVQPPVKAAGNLSAVVAFALRQQGKPYVYGTSGPNSYDCSGLVMAAYAQIGVRLPHQSEQIRARGTVVPQSQWFPGMILWAPGHVGIFLGSNKMVHASRAGKPVAVVTIYQSFTGIRVT
jgi:peptidoglycan DL-endopeptidase CwlO